MNEEKLSQILTKDLVRIAIRANNVVLQGTYPGEISDEVAELLEMCRNVYDTFVMPMEEKEYARTEK